MIFSFSAAGTLLYSFGIGLKADSRPEARIITVLELEVGRRYIDVLVQ